MPVPSMKVSSTPIHTTPTSTPLSSIHACHICVQGLGLRDINLIICPCPLRSMQTLPAFGPTVVIQHFLFFDIFLFSQFQQTSSCCSKCALYFLECKTHLSMQTPDCTNEQTTTFHTAA